MPQLVFVLLSNLQMKDREVGKAALDLQFLYQQATPLLQKRRPTLHAGEGAAPY